MLYPIRIVVLAATHVAVCQHVTIVAACREDDGTFDVVVKDLTPTPLALYVQRGVPYSVVWPMDWGVRSGRPRTGRLETFRRNNVELSGPGS